MRQNGAQMNLGEHLKIMKQCILCRRRYRYRIISPNKQLLLVRVHVNNVKNTKYQILLSYDKLMKIQFNNTVRIISMFAQIWFQFSGNIIDAADQQKLVSQI